MKKLKEKHFRGLLLALTLIASIWGGDKACADSYYLYGGLTGSWTELAEFSSTTESNVYKCTYTPKASGNFYFRVTAKSSKESDYTNEMGPSPNNEDASITLGTPYTMAWTDANNKKALTFSVTANTTYTFTLNYSDSDRPVITVTAGSTSGGDEGGTSGYKATDGYYYYLVLAKGTFDNSQVFQFSSAEKKYFSIKETGTTTVNSNKVSLGNVTVDVKSLGLGDEWWQSTVNNNTGLVFYFIRTTTENDYNNATIIHQNDGNINYNNDTFKSAPNTSWTSEDNKTGIGILLADIFKDANSLSFVLQGKQLSSNDVGYGQSFGQFFLKGVVKNESSEIVIPPFVVGEKTYIFRTFSTNQNYDLPDGLKAYVAHDFTTNTSAEGGEGYVNLRRITYIPANTCGMLLVGETDENYTLIPRYQNLINDSTDLWYKKSSYTADTWNNYFRGNYSTQIEKNDLPSGRKDDKGKFTCCYFYLYKLSKTTLWKDGMTDRYGFFRVKDGHSLLKVNKAYLVLPVDKLKGDGLDLSYEYDDATNSSKFFGLTFDDLEESGETTAIANVKGSVEDQAWYTLQGTRMNKPTHSGIYIHAGKKVFVK